MIIDSHCHLQMEDFSEDLPSVLRNASNNNICSFVVIGYDIESSKNAMRLAREYGYIHPVYGIHPYDTAKYEDSVFEELENIIKEYPPIAIGETGLDYYRDYSPKQKQKHFLHKHIDLANKFNLPLVIHVRDAFDDLYKIMKVSDRKNDILHCFTGSRPDIERLGEFDMFFGITGIVTFKNSDLKDMVKLIPKNRLLIETDSPYLAPVPVRGRRNEPKHIIYTLETLAQFLDSKTEELEKILIQNTREAYRFKFDECKG